MEKREAGGRLTLARLAVFSSPVLLFQALELPWRMYVPAFFAQQLGLSLAAVGALLMWVRLFDMGADTVVGWASDRFPSRYGHRRPWMAAGLPLILLGTWQVFFAQPGIDIATLAAWCMVLHLGYALTVTPHGGWGLEIARDHHERTRVMGAKVWFAAAGTPLILAMPAIGERWFGAGLADQVHLLGIALMLLAAASVVAVLALIPELPPSPRREPQGTDLGAALRAVLRDRALLLILALYALVGLSEAGSATTFLFLVDDALGLPGWGSTLILVQMLVGLVAIPVWSAVSRRIGKRHALAGVFAWKAVAAPFALLLPQGQLAPLVLFLVFANLSWGGDYTLLRSMVADLSGRDLAARGARNSGTYYAVFNISLKFAGALGVGAVLWLLARIGFDPAAAKGAPTDALRFVYALPTSAAATLALLLLWRGGGAYDRAAGAGTPPRPLPATRDTGCAA